MDIWNSRQKYVCSYNNASLVSISNGFLIYIFFIIKNTNSGVYIYIYLHIYPLTHWYLNLPEPDMTGWSSAETDRVDEDASSKMESIALGYAILQKIKREVRGRKDNFSKIKLCTCP